jgi:hypothetical protein
MDHRVKPGGDEASAKAASGPVCTDHRIKSGGDEE